MPLPRFLPTNRNAKADQSSLENDRTPTYTSNVATAPTTTHTLSGRDSVTLPDGTESSLTGTLGVANYIYYRIYAEDGAIPSKTPAAPSDPFLGRIKARSVPPPHTAKAVKRCIAKMENIKDRTSTTLFVTPYSESPMGDADKVTILNRTGPGSTPQEPLALVAKMSDSERSALESGGRDGLASPAEVDTTPSEIRYLYYLLYADDCETPSKLAIDPEEPCLGRIRADSVAPPHSPASIKRCISRVEKAPGLVHADLFADISCDTPLEEGHTISILRTDCPGLSRNVPMAIVQVPIVQVECPIPDGKYFIRNRGADICWSAYTNPIQTVYFCPAIVTGNLMTPSYAFLHWNITHDTNGNIFMRSSYAPSSWVGADIKGSTVPVPWRLIPVVDNVYYLTTEVNRVSQNPRVPAAQPEMSHSNSPGMMATLNEGDQRHMWEFVCI